MLQNLVSVLVQQVMPQAVATGLFVSLCTAQAPAGTKTPYGQPDGTFSNVAGLVNIPCMDSVLATGTIEATEVKELQDIMSKAFRHVVLNGWYPQFIPGAAIGWRVIVDGIVYDLLGAEQDSQSSQTRLKLQLVTVAA
jgi:cytochrome bd-type quinol oxidase subunit 1